VGTGIGGGFIVSGRPVGWDGPAIAEIGQLQPHFLDTAMTVERWASGQGIEHRFAQHHGDTEIQSSIPSGVKEPGSRPLAGVPDIAARARRGDVVARRVLDEAWEVLGWAVAQMVTLLAVEVVVIGGGVSLLGELQFFVPVRRAAAARVYAPLRDRFRIVPAALGEQVVLHGAIEAVLLDE
jgi:glucokinase